MVVPDGNCFTAIRQGGVVGGGSDTQMMGRESLAMPYLDTAQVEIVGADGAPCRVSWRGFEPSS